MNYHQLGADRIFVGDCLDIMREWEDQTFDFVFTDPPYNVGKNYGAGYDDSMPEEQYFEIMGQVVSECRRLARRGIAFYVGSKRTRMFWDLIPDGRVVIVKKGAIGTPHPDTRFYRQWSSLHVTALPNRHLYDIWEGIRMPGEGYFFREKRYRHPGLTSELFTVKILREFTLPGDRVLDPFSGTGTTIAACRTTGRYGVGIERNPKYVSMAIERLTHENATQTEFPNAITWANASPQARNKITRAGEDQHSLTLAGDFADSDDGD